MTSLYLQLHEFATLERYSVNPHMTVTQSPECAPLVPTLGPLFAEFTSFYVMLPSLLDVSEEHSSACGCPAPFAALSCYGDEEVDQAWARFLVMNNVTDVPEGNCLVRSSPGGIKNLVDVYLADGESLKDIYPRTEGRIGGTSVRFRHDYNGANVLVPSAWIEESEENLKTLLSMLGSPYLSFRGVARTASDQSNSLSLAHRDAGGMFTFSSNDEIDYFWSELFPKMFDISDKSVFPPVLGGNHAAILSSGPRKDDWTKACPPEWTLEERAEKCISVQEAVYGTTGLKRLEAIKEAVDPNYMFDCTRCIGNNRPKTNKPVEEEDNSDSGVLEVEGEGVQSTDENSGALLIGKSLPVIVVVVGWTGSQFMF